MLILLLFRPDAAERFIDCDISDGSISVAGSEIPLDGSALIDAYSEIERQASSLVPDEINDFLSSISEWIRKTFTKAD